LEAIVERQALFPEELVAAQAWAPIDGGSLDETASRLAEVFPPVFLPLFEREGDIVAQHVSPGSSADHSGWFHLPHDEAEPRLIASRLAYLPKRLLRPPFLVVSNLQEVRNAASTMATTLGLEPVPAEALYEPLKTRYSPPFDAQLDPDDGESQVTAVFAKVEWGDEARARDVLEQLFISYPNDTYVLTALAVARASTDGVSAIALAKRVLNTEITHGFGGTARHFVRDLTSSAAILEAMRGIAAASIDDADVLAPIRSQSLTERGGSGALRAVARGLKSRGEHARAVASLRNAAFAAGRWAAIDRSLHEELAEATRLVDDSALAVDLALLAASSVAKGP
jgi:hypothetical protein